MARVMVALITPFTKEGAIDFPALKQLTARLMKEGVDGFIVCGTTAETPTLTQEERHAVLEFLCKETMHEVELWYGCGTNDTASTIQEVNAVCSYPINGVLLVTPYYNRPSQEGMYAHFAQIARQSPLPIMLYNVPSRTGVSLKKETILRLCREYPNIVALKQACDDLEAVRSIKASHPSFLIYSGEDGALDEGMDAGMDGLISVMGHVNLLDIRRFLMDGRRDNRLRKKLKKEAALLFAEPSPAGIKHVLALRGEIEDRLRLPMLTIQSEALKRELQATFLDRV